MWIPLRYFFRQLAYSSLSKRRILFLGTDEFSLASLKAIQEHVQYKDLEVTYADSNRSRHPIRDYAKQAGLKTHIWPCSYIQKNEFDLGVVASFGHLLPKTFIAKFPSGIINVHGSLLPRWRGASPVVYAILNGDKESGVTIMNVEPHRFDQGRMLANERCTIGPDMTSKELLCSLAIIGGNLVVKVLNDYAHYKANAQIQTQCDATKAPVIKSKDIFFIDWPNKTSQEIYNQWRALNDIGRLLSIGKNRRKEDIIIKFSKNRPLILNDSQIPLQWIPWAAKDLSLVQPGAALYLQSINSIAIKAKEDWISFSELHIGKKGLTPRDFFNGYLNQHKYPFYFKSLIMK
nr:methionyl-tRNA formyltransferase, mitochondrial-like [Lepeophtheirus salmonis]